METGAASDGDPAVVCHLGGPHSSYCVGHHRPGRKTDAYRTASAGHGVDGSRAGMLPSAAIDARLCRWRAREATESVRTMIVDRAIYRDGRRTAEPLELGHMDDAFRAGGGLAWVGLYRPTEQEFAAVAAEFGLHELAVEDAVHPHQRPKLERRYGDTLFCVLRPARYVDETETVEFSEVHVFAGPHFVVTVRHGEAPDIAAVRRALESRPDLLPRGPVAILHAIMDRVLDDYAPVVAGVENDIDEIEDEVFNGVSSRLVGEVAA